MKSLQKYFLSRLPVMVAVSLLAIGYAVSTRNLSERKTLHEQLAAATGLQINNQSLQWVDAPISPCLKTATQFRDLAFLATRPQQKFQDLYLARVKVAPPQRIIEVSTPLNLTSSDAGDDYEFKIQGESIAVSTRVLGQVRTLTVFNLRGAVFPADRSWPLMQRLLGRVTEFQKSGRLAGIEKTTIRFPVPAKEVTFSFGHSAHGPALQLEWTDSKTRRNRSTVRLHTLVADNTAVQVLKEVRLPKRPILWLVDSIRELSFIGPGPIEWAEGRFFAMKDKFHQLKYSISGDDGGEGTDGFEPGAQQVELKLPEGAEVGDYPQLTWPPKELAAPVFASKKTGEGIWVPADPDFMKALPNAPPSVYKTYIRSDQSRPYVQVKLYAIDTRQLDLRMVGGHEDPISTTGEVGTGQLPRDKATVENVALIFNGAFKTIHGGYGMMADRTVLLPPKEEAATVATDTQGRVLLGSWPKGGAIPDNMVSFRQNMDPLLEDGVVNPRKRYLWGFTLGSDISQMNTIRSGVCLRKDGILVYAWGDDLTADSLGVAMRAAECTYGVHLDMNPFHTSLVAFRMEYRGEEILPKFEYRKLIKDIRFWPDRYVFGAPKDFFYMVLRQTTPPGENWTAEKITQPAPAFLPSIFMKEENGISMVAVDSDAVRPMLLPGVIPAGATESAPPANPIPDDLALVAETLLGKWSSGRGQMTKGTIVATLKPDEATLFMDESGDMQIAPWDPNQLRTQEALQGFWLLRDGQAQQGAGETVAIARHQKWIYFARGKAALVVTALQSLGVQTAIGFNTADADILIRRGGNMTTISGIRQNSRDLSVAALRFSAAQRPSFGAGLAQLFPSIRP